MIALKFILFGNQRVNLIDRSEAVECIAMTAIFEPLPGHEWRLLNSVRKLSRAWFWWQCDMWDEDEWATLDANHFHNFIRRSNSAKLLNCFDLIIILATFHRNVVFGSRIRCQHFASSNSTTEPQSNIQCGRTMASQCLLPAAINLCHVKVISSSPFAGLSSNLLLIQFAAIKYYFNIWIRFSVYRRISRWHQINSTRNTLWMSKLFSETASVSNYKLYIFVCAVYALRIGVYIASLL